MAQKADVKFINARYQALKNDRQEWMNKWSETAKLFYPNGFRDSSYTNDSKRLHNQSPDVLDSTSIHATNTLASGMYGALTSPSRPWFALRPQGFELDKNHDVKMYIDEVEERMRVILLNSKFYNTMHETYRQLGTFGTACVFGQSTPATRIWQAIKKPLFLLTALFLSQKTRNLKLIMACLLMSTAPVRQRFSQNNTKAKTRQPILPLRKAVRFLR